MRLFITSASPAAVRILGESFFRVGTDGSIFEFDPAELFGAEKESCFVSAILIVTPISQSGLDPICAELLFSPSGMDIALASKSTAVRAVDWSIEAENGTALERVYELIPDCPRRERRLEAKQLDRLEYERGAGKKAEVFLYRDCGMRLSIRENGKERGFILGSGEDGELRMLDAGFSRLLAAHIKGCADGISTELESAGGERIMLFNEHFELAGEICGDRLSFENGYLVAINELGTVLAHQQKLKYEIGAEGVRVICGELADDSVDAVGEIGYFTHPKCRASSEEEAALAFMECVLLAREDEAMELLSPALAEGLEFDGLFEFFGDFDEARKAPFCEKNDPPIIGAVREDRARAYAFDFKNGLINNISELEPPALRQQREGGTEEA